jgi:hypothetical protein
MFSFRRKPTKKDSDPQIYASPSLPTLSPQGIPWPENLVDVTSIRQESSPEKSHLQGAAKTSFSSINHPHISFHKPFYGSPGKTVNGISISSLYMSNAPSAFENWKSAHPPPARKNQRRVRVPPTFNLMVRRTVLCIWFSFLTRRSGRRWRRHGEDIFVAIAPGNSRHLTNGN